MADEAITAELEAPDTADPSVEQPETDPTENTTDEGSTETGDAAETTDSDTDQPELPDGIDLAKHATVKKLIDEALKSQEARLSESYRQREETAKQQAEREALERRYSADMEQASARRMDSTYRELSAHLDEVAQGKADFKPEVVTNAIQRLANGYGTQVAMLLTGDGSTERPGALNKWLKARLGDGYPIPAELADRYARAQAQNNFVGMFESSADIALQGGFAAGWQEGRKALEKEQAERAVAAKKSGELAKADTSRSGKGATVIPGANAPTGRQPAPKSLGEAATLLAEGRISLAEYKHWKPRLRSA